MVRSSQTSIAGPPLRLDVGDQAVNGNSQARRVGLTSRGDTSLKNSIVFIALRRVFFTLLLAGYSIWHWNLPS